METKILLTGFRPFSVYPVNSSWEAARLVKESDDAVTIKELTVDHTAAHVEIISAVQSLKPEILLLSGLADRGCVALETIARKPTALSFFEGPDVFAGRWPWKETMASLAASKIRFTVSEDAGQYVCESVYWSALNFRNLHGYPKFVGFVHVPLISEAWPVTGIAKALHVVLKAASHPSRFE